MKVSEFLFIKSLPSSLYGALGQIPNVFMERSREREVLIPIEDVMQRSKEGVGVTKNCFEGDGPGGRVGCLENVIASFCSYVLIQSKNKLFIDPAIKCTYSSAQKDTVHKSPFELPVTFERRQGRCF